MKAINQNEMRAKKHLLKGKISSYRIENCDSHKLTKPYSEQDIIRLQEIFLTNGWHCLQVQNLHEGRSVINTMLYSLNYYHDIACLTLRDYPLLDSVCFDVYLHALEKGCLDSDPYDLNSFFLDYFFADFLWIEETEELVASQWYGPFLQSLHDVQIEKHIPVIMLSYKS